MIQHKILLLFFAAGLAVAATAQPTSTVTDPEKKYKDAKELFVREQYALAFPLFKELKQQYPDNSISSHTYINDDVNYFWWCAN